jgi:hypothetical protein
VYSIIRRARLFQQLGRLEPTTPEEAAAVAAAASKKDATHPALAAAAAKNTPATRDLHSSAKVPSNVTSTIELAESDAPKQAAAVGDKPVPMLPAADNAAGAAAAGDANGASSSSSVGGQLSSSTAPSQSFVPTAAWKNSWKRVLPLEPIYRLLDFFQPKIDVLLSSWGNGSATHAGQGPPIDESAILAMIGQTTLVGVLPVPHPIVVRRYIPNAFTNLVSPGRHKQSCSVTSRLRRAVSVAHFLLLSSLVLRCLLSGSPLSSPASCSCGNSR